MVTTLVKLFRMVVTPTSILDTSTVTAITIQAAMTQNKPPTTISPIEACITFQALPPFPFAIILVVYFGEIILVATFSTPSQRLIQPLMNRG